MKTWMLAVIPLSLALFVAGCSKRDAAAPVAASKGTPVSDWEARVLNVPGPVLVDFTAPWCGPCKLMEPALNSIAKDYQVVKVDFDSNRDLVSRYGITGIPALLIFADGKLAKRRVGLTDESVLRADLKALSR